MPPPSSASLPASVLFVSSNVASSFTKIPPPSPLASLPRTVDRRMVSRPSVMKIPPPTSAAWLPLMRERMSVTLPSTESAPPAWPVEFATPS